jgi:hypothetical protein
MNKRDLILKELHKKVKYENGFKSLERDASFRSAENVEQKKIKLNNRKVSNKYCYPTPKFGKKSDLNKVLTSNV